jgi:hypothetical protein
MHTDTASNRITAVRPLSAAIGAEIQGLDLGRPLDDATFEELRAAWHTHSSPARLSMRTRSSPLPEGSGRLRPW